MTAGRWACRLMGHRLRFHADGQTMHWECARGCGQAGGHKTYDTAEQAIRYAAAFDRTGDLDKRAPMLGLLPLRLWHKLRQ
ncbi:hypothetical protein [Mycobacterium shimoidei]|uniref:Uncharacterized protein n=1 Tax=Mycobacterium shimoidei TaxID=29313 RepID=A0A1E3TI29_MYCSH|nr:hypothetical protein [Mycobacterium shimoidei]MCV7257561.1 hypothetical protein [Mycobacterium shimoidei]ODR14031.1 hypothetical protein BHQ16_08360 [Mycobacterium shimoidei]ORW82501.1 hypothetical protein AWC26_04270 [Mycobacterium shimoidei]SRX94107.1 hypothetical protein MSP7336_02355 [Mycobacterium shimoidei]